MNFRKALDWRKALIYTHRWLGIALTAVFVILGGIIALRFERASRWNRWLYHGFHSLDFPFLYYKRPLWDIVVILLSIGGVAISVTSALPALRRFVRLSRRLRSRPDVSRSPTRPR